MTENEQFFEFGYNKYTEIEEKIIPLNQLLVDLAELNIICMSKPEKIVVSMDYINKMAREMHSFKDFPPIMVEVDELGKFVTVVDGFHRILAHNKANQNKIKALKIKKLR